MTDYLAVWAAESEIIDEAYRICGQLAPGEIASSPQVQRAGLHLQSIAGTPSERSVALAKILGMDLVAAERERCAKRADETIAFGKSLEALTPEYARGIQHGAEAIAAKIRSVE